MMYYDIRVKMPFSLLLSGASGSGKEDSGRKLKKICYDQGTEFKNKHFQNVLKDEGINGYEAINDTKAAIVERCNRTCKNKMYRYFTAANTFRYVDVLQNLVKSYNMRLHGQRKFSKLKL